jgi:hypothetical protein
MNSSRTGVATMSAVQSGRSQWKLRTAKMIAVSSVVYLRTVPSLMYPATELPAYTDSD